MSLMRAFTHDFESVELTSDEMSAFGELVKSACYPDLQNMLSAWLASTAKAQIPSVCDYAGRQVERMWRTESTM